MKVYANLKEMWWDTYFDRMTTKEVMKELGMDEETLGLQNILDKGWKILYWIQPKPEYDLITEILAEYDGNYIFPVVLGNGKVFICELSYGDAYDYTSTIKEVIDDIEWED